MPKFRKKPVVIEAHQFSGWDDEGDPIFNTDPTGWLLDAITDSVVDWGQDRILVINTLEGQHVASEGDWIIRGVKGVYPCKPDIFAATYEPA
jgi:hypothetical protein